MYRERLPNLRVRGSMEKDNDQVNMVEKQLKDLKILEEAKNTAKPSSSNSNEKIKIMNGNVVYCDPFEVIESLLANLRDGK